MKKVIFILLTSLLLLATGACRRATDNGKIDGFWQIREIQYNDGTTVRPNGKFICVQLELMQLQTPSNGLITGVLDYHKNASELGVDFRLNPSDDFLYSYGFAPDPQLSGSTNKFCILTIERADSRHLVLRSPIAVITCRKY